MTLTAKNLPESSGSGKPGESAKPSSSKTGQSPRSNPVCLEAAVTIRSLPAEDASVGPPIREEARTVIVFDNGAVLRTTSRLVPGRTVIVSNASGRDVVCRIASGRNLPSIKGYIEVEFIEPVNDFWGIHQDATPLTVVPSTAPAIPRELPAPAASEPSTSTSETRAKPSAPSAGAVLPFEQAPAVAGVPSSPVFREPSATNPALRASAEPFTDPGNKAGSGYSHAQVAVPDSIANWQPAAPEAPVAKVAVEPPREISANEPAPPAQPRDFMSKGLMAYEQSQSSDGASSGRVPLIVGVAALVLAGACGVFFLTHRTPTPAPGTAAVSQSTAPAAPAASDTRPTTPVTTNETAAALPPEQNASPQEQLQVDPIGPSAAASPVPAVVTSSSGFDDRTSARSARKTDKSDKGAVAKQADVSASRHSAIPSLSMASPSAPARNVGNLGDGAAPLTDVATSEPVGATPAGLLTSAGKTSKPPAAPASAPPTPAPPPAPKIVHDPKLMSSVRPVYPLAAKQANVQGSVTITATVDENGKVVSAKALNGPLLLRAAAVDSVSQWKYAPGTLDGKPVASQVTVSVEFRMN